MWLVCTQKTGLSAAGLQRELGLGSYRTAWLMLQKLRQAMVCGARGERLRGCVHIDTTDLGVGDDTVCGNRGSSLVVVAVEHRGRKIGRVRLRRVLQASGDAIVDFVSDCVAPDALVRLNDWRGYARLAHRRSDRRVSRRPGSQMSAEGVSPHVRLVASLVHRWLSGTYQKTVSFKHLQRYLDEFAFRFNGRNSPHLGHLFHRLAVQLVQRRAPTYREITKTWR